MLNKCSLCESENIRELYKIKGYNVVKCKDCGFVFVKDEILKKELVDLYTQTYFHNPAWYQLDKERYFGYDDYIGDKENIRDKFDKILRVIKKHTNKGPLLDIGCGPGFFLELARERGYIAVQGIDISSYAVEYSTKTLNLDVQKGDLLDFHFAPATFNVIVIFDVLEHFQNPKEILAEIYKILNYNGILAIITPDIDTFIPKLLKDHWEEIKHIPEHISFFSKKTLTTVLQKTGFHVLETKYIGHKMSFKLFLYHTFVNLGININLDKIPLGNITISINPFYKLFLIAQK